MENSNNKNQDSVVSEPIQTYIAIGEPNSAMLEIDLVTFREKNTEMRYLGLTFTGINPKTNQPQEAFINVDNEEAFNAIKNYFTQLEWNS